MKKRTLRLSVLLTAALAGMVALVAWLNREPKYQGKSFNPDANIQLSAWYLLEAVAPEEFQKRKRPPIIQHDYVA